MSSDISTTVLWIAERNNAGCLPLYSALPRSFFSVMPCRLATALRLIAERVSYDVVAIEANTEVSDSLQAVLSADPSARIVIVDFDGLCEASDVEGAFRVATSRSALRLAIEQAAATKRPDPESQVHERSLIGTSESMRSIQDLVRLVGPRRSNVLILGETGTGKEVVARALHRASGSRANMPMVCVNCAAIPESLIEAELFGHTKGAFTGATSQYAGKFEQANGGTIFLDEIGELPLSMQAKLLRVLQEREVQRLGSAETIKLDVRVIAATNANLQRAVAEGRFREDLYYRISVVPIHLAPLRNRMSDLAALSTHFVEKICAYEGVPVKTLPEETLQWLMRYDWPGNVRQLEHAIELAVIISESRSVLLPSDFPVAVQTEQKRETTSGPGFITLPEEGIDYEEMIGDIERSILQQALTRAGGNKARAASMLGLKRTTLSAKVRALSLEEYDTALAQAC